MPIRCCKLLISSVLLQQPELQLQTVLHSYVVLHQCYLEIMEERQVGGLGVAQSVLTIVGLLLLYH